MVSLAALIVAVLALGVAVSVEIRRHYVTSWDNLVENAWRERGPDGRVAAVARVLSSLCEIIDTEMCGLLYEDGMYNVTNVAKEPQREYAMDPSEQTAIMSSLGWPEMVYHTHPGGRREPSTLDHKSALPGVPYMVATVGWAGVWISGRQIKEFTMGNTQSNDTGEVFEAEDGSWSWHVQAANGKVVDEGHGFNTKASAAGGLYRARPDLKPEAPTSDGTSAGDAIDGTTGSGTTAGYTGSDAGYSGSSAGYDGGSGAGTT